MIPPHHELQRKLIHLLWFFVALLYAYLYSLFERKALLFPLFLFLLFFIADILRLYCGVKLPLLHLLRSKEQHTFFTPTTTTLGIFLTFFLFPHPLALPAVLMMALGDITAAIVGITYGKHKLPFHSKKTWEGTGAAFLVNLLIGFILLPNVTIILVMSLAATLAESYTRFRDDNLVIPIVAGIAGSLASAIASG